ncbi:MAG: hypothetical protein JEZ09_06790 [Salinivirgaceae bacterium]|nr:hypothetical protein [Salinivirgaceae bacterium]
MKIYYYLIFVLFFLLKPLVSFGQHSNKLKWKQIETEHFKVIFPSEIEKQANYSATLLEKSYKEVSSGLSTKPKQIKLFLFNQSVTSNGYVSLGSKRMVWYTTPSQNSNLIGSTDWFQALAIHEFSHVSQFSAFDTNLTSFAGGLFGDYGKSLFMNFTSPLWFFEGDAVYTETKLSNNGRGRLPSFYRDIKALESNDIRFSYQKAYLGSYKNYFPSWYHLGFLMTNHVIENYGDDAWKNVVKRTTKSISPYSFSRSLKKNTGFNTRKTYINTLNEFKAKQNELYAQKTFAEYKKINTKNNKHYTNYYYPYSIGLDSVIAFKRGFDNSGSLVLIDSKKESELLKINPIDRIHSNGKSIVWANVVANIRWTEQSYSDIILFDIATKRRRTLTYHKKLFAPAISNSNKKIAAVEFNEKMECSLLILDFDTGKVIQKIPMPLGNFIRMPSWNKNDDSIVFTLNIGQSNYLASINITNNQISILKSFGSKNISNPVFYNDYIIYNSYANGVDAIFAYNLLSKNDYKLISTKFGAYNACLIGNEFLFQNYSVMGYTINSVNIDSLNWESFDFENEKINLWNNEISNNIFESVKMDSITKYQSKKYYPFINSIKVHSWGPYPVNRGIGFNIFSDDELLTTSAKAGLEYYPQDKANRVFTEISYSGLFPVFNLKYSKGTKYLSNSSDTISFQRIKENVLGFSMNIPLNFSRYNYERKLTISSGFDKIYQKNYEDSSFAIAHNNSLINIGLFGLFIRNSALRDVMPKFGVEFRAINYSSINSNGLLKNRTSSNLTTYLPAPFNHGFKVSIGYELSNSEYNYIYQLESDLEMIYGYDKPSFTSDSYANFLALYSFPLFYPDVALGPIIYCKRIKINAFYNYGQFREKSKILNVSSYGAEIHGEFNFFNLIFPIEIGLRISNRLYDNELSYEFMLMGIPF